MNLSYPALSLQQIPPLIWLNHRVPVPITILLIECYLIPTYFRSSFPLSWFVVALLDQLNRGVGSLEAAFFSTPTGELVAEAIRSSPQAIFNFIMDLVQMKVGSPLTGVVLNKICEEVFKEAKRHQMAATQQNEVSAEADGDRSPVYIANLRLSPVDVYETVLALLPRLHLCLRVLSLAPGLEGSDIFMQEASPNHVFNLDILLLEKAFDLMDPRSRNLLSASAKYDWAGRVTNLSTLLRRLEGLVSMEPLSTEDQTRLTATRGQCHRLEIMKMFLDHVLQADVPPSLQETVCSKDNLRPIYFALNNPDFTTSPYTFYDVRQAIENYSRKGGRVLLGFADVQECALCLESVGDPVILPCGHISCSVCLRNHFQQMDSSAARYCPKNGCEAAVPEDFSLRSKAKIREAVAQHTHFRRKLTQFFIEMTQRFVFIKGETPHQVHIHTPTKS